jgi:hypothetical protein
MNSPFPISPKTLPTQAAKQISPNSKTCSTSPPNTEKICFDPNQIFYASETGSYLIETGTHYRTYGRKSPVIAGIKRHLRAAGASENDLKDLTADQFDNIELDRACDWTGGLAGYRRGIKIHEGRKFLITSEPDMLEAKDVPWPMLQSILSQAFPAADALSVFKAWLQGGVNAIRTQTHQPAPMLVLAGDAKAGKSLLAHITKTIFGGRSSNPMTSWTGRLVWNDNLLGSELLLIDDSVSSTDPRARKAFGSNFKEAIYAGNVSINTRRKSSLDLRPVWRVMVCCNETPENLSVIPPLEEGIEDKIILLRVSKIETPMPASTPEEKTAFADAIRKEIPGFLHHLQGFTVPEHLRDTRSGVTAWKDQTLLNAVMEISPEKQLENLLALAISKGFFNIDKGASSWMSAAEVQSILVDRSSPTSSQAQALLQYYTNCGRNLTLLAKHKSPFVTDTRILTGTNLYYITRPH